MNKYSSNIIYKRKRVFPYIKQCYYDVSEYEVLAVDYYVPHVCVCARDAAVRNDLYDFHKPPACAPEVRLLRFILNKNTCFQ